MKIWCHKETGKLMLTYQVYVMWSEVRAGIKLEAPVYAGEACDNGNGVTCIFAPEIYEHFDYVGEL
jgi:hypothetical protein